LTLLFVNHFAFGQGLKKEYQKNIASFIELVKNNKKSEIAEMISFPLEREYPIPSIKNKQEFIQRFDEVFDQKIKNKITQSKPSKDWSEMGWRGIMLENGVLWMDTNGKVFRINYQSKSESILLASLIAAEKKTLHSSIANYKNPKYIIETNKFRIRIDVLEDNSYRYSSWNLKQSMSQKPDLIINNGIMIADGNGGSHHFEFKSEGYTYECYIVVIGSDESPPAQLKIYKGEKEVLSQDAIKLKG
jgi:hypothetical protein